MDWQFNESDSENDIFPTNVYTYQNESAKICAKGPNLNTTNITGISFKNNALSSNMQKPQNFERSWFVEPSTHQRSMYYRRETSPMSMHSGSVYRNRNLHQSYYNGAVRSQRSVYNGRSGSPMSMRSIDSNVSVSANDIALAFKNIKFNKFDTKIIKDAYNKFMKRRRRQKIEKRRNMRLFLKACRRKSGYDSGEQGSDSSISSDNCKSTSSALYQNMSSCRSTHTNFSEFRHQIRDSNMFKDCSEHLMKHSFKNKISLSQCKDNNNTNVCLDSVPGTMRHGFKRQPKNKEPNFKNGILLSSLSCDKSDVSLSINKKGGLCKQNSLQSKESNEKLTRNNSFNAELDSDEEIFFNGTVRERINDNEINNSEKCVGKRNLDNEVHQNKIQKKPKICKKDDFQFLKPQQPVKKSGNSKMNTIKMNETLISKSPAPLTNIMMPQMESPNECNEKFSKDKSTVAIDDANDKIEDQLATLPSTDTNDEVAMRPSFIKRKLYTQKMDVIENKNSDCLNSSRNDLYSSIRREKHKARKLVTNQLCLNRDVSQEDNNLLDLIHKIVPPEQMNVTNITNKTSLSCKNVQENKTHDDERWDVTSVISTCNNDNVSDTYTDEEIFNSNNKKNKNKKSKVTNDYLPSASQGNGVVKKITVPAEKPVCPKNVINDQNIISIYSKAKSFWDIDSESDMDINLQRCTTKQKENQYRNINQHVVDDKDCHKHDKMNYTLLSTNKGKPIRNTNTENTALKPYNINKKLSISIARTSIRPDYLQNNKTTTNLNVTITEFNNLEKSNIQKHTNLPKDRTELKKQIADVESKDKSGDNNNKTVRALEKAIPIESRKRSASVTLFNAKSRRTPSKAKNNENNMKSKRAPPSSKTKNNENNMTSQEQNVNSGGWKPKTYNDNTNIEIPISNKEIGNAQKEIRSIRNKSNIVSEKTVRSKRTTKKIECCKNDYSFSQDNKAKSQEKKQTLNADNVNLSKQSTAKGSKTMIDTDLKNGKRSMRNPKTNKEKALDNSSPKIVDIEPMNRTLRNRKIDLSSTLNSSCENLTNATIRKLRTRSINLSSSISDSTLGDNIITSRKKMQKTLMEKSQLNKNNTKPKVTRQTNVKCK
ncbi:hypothetical protein ACJJTC_005757 [Scirpophaga incertulas]